MTPIIYPYKKGLNSTGLLRDAGSAVRYGTSNVRKRRAAIAWGNRIMPEWGNRVTWVNNPLAVPLVADKMNWARWCDDNKNAHLVPYLPEFLFDKDEAIGAIGDGDIVLCRTKLNASSGKGIVVARLPDEVADAPLYSVYKKKQREYRIVYGHRSGVTYISSKRRRADADMSKNDKLIRTMDNGWVYQSETDIPDAVGEAIGNVGTALFRLGLGLLAYDVGYDVDEDSACIYECNTAWGLNVASAEATLNAIKECAR